MFYSQFILAKKGPLGTIWIAAHLERKLRKNQVAETDIGVTVDNILFPEVPIALRLSGHLLLGVVRIYSRQVNYLFNDCSETLGKIKQAFHSAAVDLPPEATTAPFHTITLPETFDFDELELGPDPENAFLYSKGKFVDHHVTTREQITLQDSIQNNPYLGSSQFGLDERFGDGSYSSLGLDFDEEFWGSKAGPSSVASTSTPLLKEDTVVLPAGGENEVTHMDVDDPYGQPLESDIQRSMAIREAVHTDARQVEMDNQLNMSFPASLSTQFNEPHGLETASRKVSDFAALKNDTPSFHAYTPRVLEACTPDLNREYRPPDEPSTPALVDETSLPMYKECTAKTAGSVSPATLGITEKSSSGLLPASSSPQQVSGVSTLVSSSQAARSPSPASFQGLPVHQAAPAVTNREAFVTQKEKGPFLAVEENASSVPAPLQSVPEISLLQQKSTLVSHEGAVFPTGTSSFLTTPESSLSSLRQQDGNLSITANHQLAGIVHPELYPRSQNEGLAGDSQNLVSSSAAMMELAGTVNHELGERLQQQGLAVGSQNLVSSFGAMIGSAGKINDGVHESSPQQGLASGSPNSASLLGAKAGLAGTQGMYPSFQQQGLAVGSQNPMSSLPSSGAMAGTAGTLDHGGHASSQQREFAVSSPNQVSLSGAMAGSVGAVNQRSYPSFQQQGLAVASPNPVSSSPLSGAAGSAGTVDHGVRLSSQQQGFAVASPNPASSWPLSGAAGSAGTVDHGVRVSSQQQGFAVASPNAASSLPSSGAVGSTGTVDHGARVSSQQQGFAVASPNPASSLPSSGAVKSTGTVDHGAHVSSQQQGTAIALPNSVSSLPSSGAMGLVGTVEHGVYMTSQHQGLAVASPDHQGLAVASPNPVSLLPSLGGTGSAGTVDHGVDVTSRQQVPGVGSSNQVHMSSRQQVPGVGSSNQVSFFGAMAGSAGTEKQGTHPSSQQQGLAIASPSPVPPLASATIGQAGTADHGVHDSSHQQQGLAVGSLNPVSSFKAMAGLAGTGSYPSFQQQHLAITSLPVSSLSSAMSTPAGITDREVNLSPQREGTVAGSPNPVPSSGAIAGTKSQGTHPSFQEQGLAVASANSIASVSSLGAMAGPAGAADHGVYKSSQQKELAVSSPSPTSLFGEMAVLSGTGSQEGHPTSQQQGLAAASLNAVSSSPSFGAMIGSTGSLNHGAHASSQQQGLAVGSPNAAPSFGAIAGSAGTRIQGTQSNFQQQGPAAASLNASLSSLGDMVGLPGTGNHGVHASSQKQGLAVGSPNPVSSFGAMAGSAGTGSRGIYPSFQQQGPAAASPNPMSSSAYGAMLGSAGSVSHGLQAFSHQQGFAAGSQTPVSSFGAMARSIGTVNQEAYSSFQQQGPAFGPQNPVASFGAVVDSAVSPSPSTMRSMGANKMLASPFMTGASNAPLFSPNSGSILPVTNTLPTGQMSTRANKETMHETMDSAGFKDPVRSSVTQQVSLPSPTVRPGILPSMRLGERETLRSAYDLQSGGPGYLMMQKDLSVERIPSLEMERNRSFNVSTGGFTKEASLPAMDKIPLWREGTPQSLPREPFFPTQNISSHPADDDVLASILGRRNRDFKVLETPKDPKEPKVNAAKRPKRPPRITPKKRKIEIDTVAVLHGDVIRQQLANAEDIRRDRRKAPCTRREVWAFIRECEGQENFDEPTLPELSQNLHDLYHDVLHGRESRPSSSAPNGAMNANQPSESHLIRGGLTDSLVPGVNKQANMLGPRSESNREVDRTYEDFNRDILIDKSEGYKNNSSENLAEPLNADAKVEIIQTNAYVSSMEAENPENPSAKEFYKPEAGSERLAGKERDGIAPPEVQALEVYNPSSLVSRETEANEQAKQILSLDREDEASDPQREVPAISLSENVVGVIGADEGIAMTMPKEVLGIVGGDVGTQELVMTMPKVVFGAVGGDVVTQERALTMTMQKDVFGVVGGDVGTQERALMVQHDTERVEEKQQLSFGVPEHEVASLGMESDFKPLDIPSDGKDLTEVPRSDGKDVLEVPLLNVVDPGRGIMEGQIEVPMLDGKDAPEMPPFYVVDIEKGKLEGRTEVPMSDGKDVPEMPPFYAVDIEKGNLEGRTEVPMSDVNDVSQMPLFNVVDVERGNMEARTEVPMPDGKHVSEVPLLNIVDIEKGNMEVRTEVPMSDGKHISEVPLLNIVDVGNGNMEGRTEVPMSDGKDVSGLPLPNIVDMDKGNMEAGDKLLNAEKGSMEGFSNLPTSNVTEGERNCRKDDEDIAAMECDRDADYADDHDDDNDIAFAEIDYSSDEQDASIQDSNGWSARSRNVGRYLKTAFGEMEGNLKRSEQPTLALERLLARKTKREAARMFFETLVLKTKDYIHVEQNVAYQEIHLFPRSKLMKTEF